MRALFVERFGHHRQSRLSPRERQHLESLLPETLKGVRRAPWLECTTAERRGASGTDRARCHDDLLLRFHGTRAGDDGNVLRAERDAGCDVDDGVLLLPLTRDLLVGLANVDHFGHAGQGLDPGAVHAPIVADEADRGPLLAGHWASLVPHLLYRLHDAFDVFSRRVILHYDQHQSSSISMDQPSLARATGPANRAC